MVTLISGLLGLIFLWGSAGSVTHYGVSYHGQQMGCEGSGLYDTNNSWIIAAPKHSGLKCGDLVYVSGPAGVNMGIVLDSCPGCRSTNLDLSEAGIARVCGLGADYCEVLWAKVQL